MTDKEDIKCLTFGILSTIGGMCAILGLIFGICGSVYYAEGLKTYNGPIKCTVINLNITSKLCTRDDHVQRCYTAVWKVEFRDRDEPFNGWIWSGTKYYMKEAEYARDEYKSGTRSDCWYKVSDPSSLRWSQYVPKAWLTFMIVGWCLCGSGILLILLGFVPCCIC